jgi:hypothetical protein
MGRFFFETKDMQGLRRYNKIQDKIFSCSINGLGLNCNPIPSSGTQFASEGRIVYLIQGK